MRVDQDPFLWIDGVWQANVTVFLPDDDESLRTVIRVTPDTLRRWKDVGIDPVVEACAQLRDHLKVAENGNGNHAPLTLL